MKVRRATCIHGLVLGLAAILATQMLPLLSSSAVAADDGMKWQFNEANDPDNKGRMTARLIYGVPETDAIQVSGVCEARSGSGLQASSLMLGADIGALDDGKEVDVHFSGDGFDRTLKGVVHQQTSEEGLSGVVLEVENDDPLWGALTAGQALDYALPGLQPATLPADGGADAIEQFVQACKSYADALGAGGDGDDAAAASSPDEAARATRNPLSRVPRSLEPSRHGKPSCRISRPASTPISRALTSRSSAGRTPSKALGHRLLAGPSMCRRRRGRHRRRHPN